MSLIILPTKKHNTIIRPLLFCMIENLSKKPVLANRCKPSPKRVRVRKLRRERIERVNNMYDERDSFYPFIIIMTIYLMG